MASSSTVRVPAVDAGSGARSRPTLWHAALAWAPAVALGVFLLAAVRAGLPAQGAVRALLAVAITQVLPGVLVWRLVRPVRGWWLEDIVVGFAIGAALAVGAQTAAGALQMPWMGWVPGVCVAAAIILIPRPRSRVATVGCTALPAALGPIVAAISLLLLLPTQRFYRLVPLTWPEGFRASSAIDIPFHLALTGQLAHRGPAEVPFVLGEPLSYHWFSHAWVAQTATTAGVPLDAVLLRFGPPLTAVLVVLAVVVAGIRLTDRAWAGPLAALIAVGGGDLNVLGTLVPGTRAVLVTPGALSLAFSSVLMLALLCVLGLRWRVEAKAGTAVLVVLLAVASAGSKGSSLSIVVAGTGLAFVLSWLLRLPVRRTVSVDLLLVGASLVAAVLVVFRADASRLRLAPGDALSEAGVSALLLNGVEQPGVVVIALAGVLVLVSVLGRGAGILGAAVVPRLRRDPVVPLVTGAGLAGAAAVVLLSAAGKGQYYFLRNAVPVLGVASAVGFVGLWEALGPRRARVFGTAAIVGLTALVLQAYGFREIAEGQAGLASVALIRTLILVAVVIAGGVLAARGADFSTRSTLAAVVAAASVALVINSVVPTVLDRFRTPLPAYNAPVDALDRFAFSRDQIDAARWLRDHSNVNDIVMTNRHCTSPVWVNCDSRRFSVAAYTERRVLVEGWAYTRSWARSEGVQGSVYRPFWDEELLALNDSFIESPDAETAAAIKRHGVRWIYIDKTAAYSDELDDHAQPRFETRWAMVLELDIEAHRRDAPPVRQQRGSRGQALRSAAWAWGKRNHR